MIQFTDMEAVGYISQFLNECDDRGAVEQIDSHYAHGGGWSDFQGHILKGNTLSYPGDPPMTALSEGKLRDERILVFRSGWVAVVQEDESFRVARID